MLVVNDVTIPDFKQNIATQHLAPYTMRFRRIKYQHGQRKELNNFEV